MTDQRKKSIQIQIQIPKALLFVIGLLLLGWGGGVFTMGLAYAPPEIPTAPIAVAALTVGMLFTLAGAGD